MAGAARAACSHISKDAGAGRWNEGLENDPGGENDLRKKEVECEIGREPGALINSWRPAEFFHGFLGKATLPARTLAPLSWVK